jgi:hypothetical protein
MCIRGTYLTCLYECSIWLSNCYVGTIASTGRNTLHICRDVRNGKIEIRFTAAEKPFDILQFSWCVFILCIYTYNGHIWASLIMPLLLMKNKTKLVGSENESDLPVCVCCFKFNMLEAIMIITKLNIISWKNIIYIAEHATNRSH